jgi:putative aldouronate transport system permease protein
MGPFKSTIKSTTVEERPATFVPHRVPTITYIRRNWMLYSMLLLGVTHFVIFKYIPMAYLAIAFQDFSPSRGLIGSSWVGFRHFERLFTSGLFLQLLRNTAVIALINQVLYFPVPIILALLITEVRRSPFKRLFQTLLYVPFFVSWPVVASITHVFLTTQGGTLNELLVTLGFERQPFLMSTQYFHGVYYGQLLWKNAGFGTVIYLASIAGINPELYDSALVDGAGRFQRAWHITLPSIRSTVVILFILNLGRFLEVGFEQVFLLRNPLNRSVSEIFDTYVYAFGIQQGQYSYTAAIGVFTSFVGLALIVVGDYVAKKLGEDGIL